MDGDDMAPEPDTAIGRIENGFGAAGAKTCGSCPKWDVPRLWCPVRAASRSASSPACRYGAALMEKQRWEK